MTQQNLMMPTVHLNGTPREQLMQQLLDAISLLQDAADAMAKAAPHGRDYYPQDRVGLTTIGAEEFPKEKEFDDEAE